MLGNFLFLGALSGGLAVIMGAFGAHALKGQLTPHAINVYQTAVEFHFYHTGALLVVALLVRSAERSRLLHTSGLLFLVGLMLFSGSLYALALSGITWLGAITPVGGVSLIAGWACLAVYALTLNKQKTVES